MDSRATRRLGRLKKELADYQKKRSPGLSFWPTAEDQLDIFEASLDGPEDSPYEGGIFRLEIRVPESYPFEPPTVKFITPVHHPNIDNEGRICLDILKFPGGWKPILSISSVLLHIQLLLKNPNPDDPLMIDIANEFKAEPELFKAKARAFTQQHASAKPEYEEGENKNPNAKRRKL